MGFSPISNKLFSKIQTEELHFHFFVLFFLEGRGNGEQRCRTLGNTL